MNWSEISSDVIFDQFGDFVITKGDVAIELNQIEIIRQNIIDRSISAYDDYELQKQYGANIHGLIGLSNVKEVESRVTSNIIYALTHDGFLNKDNINLFAKKIHDKLLLKLEITVSSVQQKPLALSFIFSANRTFTYAI
jgi:hypothetical protein